MARGRFQFNSVHVFATLLICLCAPWVVHGEGCQVPGRGDGNCVSVRDCKPIRTFMQRASKPFSRRDIKLLEAYVCGYQGNNPKVCCPSGPVVFDLEDSKNADENDNCNCVEVRSCEPVVNFMKQAPKPLRWQDVMVIVKQVCGYEGDRPQVCCPSEPIPLSNSDGDSSTAKSIQMDMPADAIKDPFAPPDVTQHKNLDLLPQECGYLGIDEKITYGDETSLFQFPWMALLSYQTDNGVKFQCGGTIVNEKYILTAAHCILSTPFPLIGVRVGEHDLRSTIDCKNNQDGTSVCAPPYQDLSIEEVIPHQQYTRAYFDYDIGLLKVTRMNLTVESTRPVCLPLSLKMRTYDFGTRNVIVTGWGAKEDRQPSPVLLRGDIPAISNDECAKIYEKTVAINFRQLCARSKNGTDACGGDSGGPLHVVGQANGDIRFIQQGIVSFGPRNCTGNPGVYTRVAHYMDWILDNLKER